MLRPNPLFPPPLPSQLRELVRQASRRLEADQTILDEQVQAARELLERDGNEARAVRLLLCRPNGESPWTDRRRACRASRVCPACAERRAARDATRIIEAAGKFERAMAVLIRCPSASLLDLPIALRTMTVALNKMRRRRWFKAGCRAGVLAVETPLTSDGKRWNLHAHAILDVTATSETRKSWIERAAREWVELVGPAGLWSHEDLVSRVAFARYAVKVNAAKSTTVEGLPPKLAAHLDRALRHRRLVRQWGLW